MFRRGIQPAIVPGGDYTMRFRAILSYLCVASLAGGLAFAAPPGQIRVEVNQVNLFVTVRDKHKSIVTGLKQDDFQLYEDGRLQEITDFSTETNLPLTIGLMLDTSGSQYYLLSAEKDGGSRFLKRLMRKGDLAMVMSFDLDVNLLADFTDDLSNLNRAINRAEINDGGGGMVEGPLPQTRPLGTNLYDAVYLAAHEKLSGEAGRKAVVILTDADDRGSKMRLQDAIEAAQRTDTAIYVLLIAADSGDQVVGNKLTEETGGRMFIVRNEKDLNRAFDDLFDELRTQYTLAYTPSNKSHDGGYRKIKVEMKNKEYSALARRGYYAPNY
jgi:VWFA-related protein